MNFPHQETVLGVFVKHPEPGKVKSRLGVEIGYENAASLYEAFVTDTIERFGHSADRLILGYTPDNKTALDWLLQQGSKETVYWPQPDTDLGKRMANYFHFAFEQHETKSAILIGSDSPTLPVSYLEQAYEWLYSVDCVLGPSADGGYYLVGLSSPQPEMFEGIEWSSSSVLEKTVERIQELGLSMKLLPLWYDVDEMANLRMLRGHLLAMKLSGRNNLPRRTEEWLANWSEASGD